MILLLHLVLNKNVIKMTGGQQRKALFFPPGGCSWMISLREAQI